MSAKKTAAPAAPKSAPQQQQPAPAAQQQQPAASNSAAELTATVEAARQRVILRPDYSPWLAISPAAGARHNLAQLAAWLRGLDARSAAAVALPSWLAGLSGSTIATAFLAAFLVGAYGARLQAR